MHDKSAIKQHIDHRAVWYLDRNRDSARYACARKDPVSQIGESLAAMWEVAFPNDSALSTEQADLVSF
jgi:hypothetical protein